MRIPCFVAVTVLSVTAAIAEDFKLTILHANDIHARIDEFDAVGSRCTPENSANNKCYGGIARQKYIVEKIRAENPNTIYINAGDYYQGTMWFYHLKGNIIAETIQILKHDAITLGNHEFDDGSAGLLPLLMRAKEINTPVLGCNVDFSKNALLSAYQPEPSIVLERGNVKIGVIGYLTPDTTFLSRVDNGTVLTDEIECIRREAQKFKAEGINIIIATGHSGYVKDQEIAAKVPEVGVVIGGHSHTYISSIDQKTGDVSKGPYPTVVTREDKSQALVVQDFWMGKYLGYINVTFDKDNGKVKNWEGDAPMLLDYTVPKDSETEKFLEKKRADIDKLADVLVGSSVYEISGDKERCRFSDCTAGTLLTQATANYFILNNKNQSSWSSIDIAIVNGGGIRGSFPKGNITFGDVVTVYPFANPIWVLTLTGKDVKAMFERSFQKFDATRLVSYGGFLHAFGARVVADVTEPVYSRIKSVEVLCGSCPTPVWKPLDLKAEYRVAMSSYVAKGGDNHTFDKVPSDKIQKFTVTDTDLAKDFFRQYSPVYPVTDGRLKIITTKERGDDDCTKGSSVSSQGSLGLVLLCFVAIFNWNVFN